MKISNMIVSIIVVVMFITVFTLYYSSLSTKYSVDYDTNSMNFFNRSTELQSEISKINQSLNTINPAESGLIDIVGSYLKSGYEVLKVTFGSLGLFTDMVGSSIDALPLGSAGAIFKWALISIIVIIFFFIIVSILIGKEV